MNLTEHLLTIVAEESGEVTQAACKAIRFGMEDYRPGTDESNRRVLEKELADLVETMSQLGIEVVMSDRLAKRKKLAKYLDVARKLGTLK